MRRLDFSLVVYDSVWTMCMTSVCLELLGALYVPVMPVRSLALVRRSSVIHSALYGRGDSWLGAIDLCH